MFYSNQRLEDCKISNKALHTFNRANCFVISDLQDKTVEEFAGMRQVGVKTVAEIEEFLELIKSEGIAEQDECGSVIDDETSLSCRELMGIPFYKEKIVEFVKTRDVPMASCDFPVRVKKRFKKLKIQWLSQVIELSDYEIDSMDGLGKKSADETREVINRFLEENATVIKGYCVKSSIDDIDEEDIRQQILSVFAGLGFDGIHFEELRDKLIVPDSFSDERIRYIVGDLINEGKLEYTDYRIYQNYPSFYNYVMGCNIVDGEKLKIIIETLDGKTQAEIGRERNVTRELIRQQLTKILEKVTDAYYKETRLLYFSEDYYKYFFIHYQLEDDKNKKEREELLEWLGMPTTTFYYLKLRYGKESKNKKEADKTHKVDIQQALEDPNVPMQIKMNIYNYNHRNMFYISGRWIAADKKSFEDYWISQICKDETRFDDFIQAFNVIIQKMESRFGKYTITESNKSTRKNRISESKNVLWCQGEVLRFYDFGRYDFSELYERLSLEKYTDIEISANKWFNDYPELMQKYDIRNQYELHNLLKKTINYNDYPNQKIDLKRMPMVAFGDCDKDKIITELLFNYAPIKQNDFADVIVRELGYDKATTLASYFKCIAGYYHNGLYVVDYPVMDQHNMDVLKNELKEDFYFFKDLKSVYKELLPDADEREINAYNLKKMGFLVYSDYVLQNHESLEEYFENLILNAKNLSEFRRKYGYNQTYYGVLRRLKHSYTILSLSEDEVVTLDQLERRVGITIEDIKEFSDEVYKFVTDGEFFTIASLRTAGFDSKLFDYGFDDWFFASILSEDERFSFCKKLGTLVLYCGQRNVTFADFIEDRVEREESIDVLDLMSDIENIYRINLSDKYDLLPGPESTMYYDNFLDRLYHTVELYHKEIEEGKT